MRSPPENAWLPIYLSFILLVNILPEAGYIALLTGIILAGRNTTILDARRIKPQLVTLLATLSILMQPYPYTNSVGCPPPASILFSTIAALAEEYFFRGLILGKTGNPIQALLFTLTHLNLTNPVYLVNSSLLVPHYFLLGLIFGKVAETQGLVYSIIFHAFYNTFSLLIYANFSLATVLYLLLIESIVYTCLHVKKQFLNK
jgi:membrane protease YdiL (CAAX protease family)